jgi:glycosyltransferase involved in cell wall biosynthesis
MMRLASGLSAESYAGVNHCDVSVVIPCLNEHETVATCVRKALAALDMAGIDGEVIVADNGSTDGSVDLAQSAGARIVPVSAKGYGNALMGGISAARGRFIVMGDADDSYDFLEVPRFVSQLQDGADLVQGCRLPGGGGTIKKGAMPWLHRWFGNPALTFLARLMFHVPVHDIYCGMRGFSRGMFQRLNLRCTGMEFATEMIIKASLFGERIAEVPITLSPDGRVTGKKHLRTFRDGWRTLRFFLLFCPRWLFWYPGLALMLAGAIGYALALPGFRILGATLDAHTLLVASMSILLGFQASAFAVMTTAYATQHGFQPSNPRVDRFFRVFTLERGVIAGVASLAAGFGLIAQAFWIWVQRDFSTMDYTSTMRIVVPGVMLAVLGQSLVFMSFLCSILGMQQRATPVAGPQAESLSFKRSQTAVPADSQRRAA